MRHTDGAGSIAPAARAAVVAVVLAGVAVLGVGSGAHIPSRFPLTSAAESDALLCPLAVPDCRKPTHPGN